MLLASACVCAQTLLTFSIEQNQPVRFGWRVPVEAVSRGLRLRGDPGARMQWRLLQETPGASGGELWATFEICGHDGPAKLLLGGEPPVVRVESGQVCARTVEEDDGEGLTDRVEIDRWVDGTIDRRTITALAEDHHGTIRRFESESCVMTRRAPVRIAAAEWRRIGMLPPADGVGRKHRRELLSVLDRLPALSDHLGRGDYARGPDRETVTNLEFDTGLGMLRLALCEDHDGCLRRAFAAARHTIDVDLDTKSGLPFRHGTDHRIARPEPGHVWTTGLLLTGAVFGETEIFDAGRDIALALAARVMGPEPQEGPFDRMRDEAWPLHEIEQALRQIDHPSLRRAAEAVASRMLARFDPELRCLRYGEGATRGGRIHRDRLWISLGLAVPALRLYAERTGEPRAFEVVASIRRLGMDLLGAGKPGLPLSTALTPGETLSASRVTGAAEGYLLLEGLEQSELRAVLARSGVSRGLAGALDPRHHDLATRFSIAARCTWITR